MICLKKNCIFDLINGTDGSRPIASYDSIDSSTKSFCYVNPKIGSGVSVTYNNKQISNSTTVNINEKGVYGLSFTSFIDPEQQPLKEIVINWGDGSTQVITGQDSHPSVNNPHIFYHYYRQTEPKTIQITISDNWDKSATR